MTDGPLIGAVTAPDLHVMTYNIRRRIPHVRRGNPDRWPTRKWLLELVLRAEQPTLLAVQEALADQVDFLSQALGPHYRRLGNGRNANGRGERTLLFYDSRRLELIDWRQRALSATPDVPGSRSWGNFVPRVVVSAQFRDVATQSRLFAFATHFDHISRKARLESARMIRALAAADHAADPDATIVVMGDVNADVTSPVYRELTADGVLRDTWEAGAERLTPQWGTFSNYRRRRVGGKRIDLILVGPGVQVLRTGINAVRFDGAAASDHEPVQAVVRAARSPDLRPPLAASSKKAAANP
ncbi:endonuclease/exonuclease/phosphatase family protein [Rathayibacter sp. YIM 133350]|uniref:endonuclease/exonuclease/phosphatase family protein n=1 Tax=Rathayibacter sp. YIM 133350 TaxID=3131992 RepID=UPI00307E191B